MFSMFETFDNFSLTQTKTFLSSCSYIWTVRCTLLHKEYNLFIPQKLQNNFGMLWNFQILCINFVTTSIKFNINFVSDHTAIITTTW